MGQRAAIRGSSRTDALAQSVTTASGQRAERSNATRHGLDEDGFQIQTYGSMKGPQTETVTRFDGGEAALSSRSSGGG